MVPEVSVARASPSEVSFGLVFASTSGFALLGYAVAGIPIVFTIPFVVFPAMCLLAALVLFRRRLYRRFHAFAETLIRGAGAGLLATLAYDVIRPLATTMFGFSFKPYRAMAVFGELITGLPGTHWVAQASGWAYHFWNGVSFGMMFALVRPQGGIVAGIIWAMVLQGLMMVTYPRLLQVRLEDPGFMIVGLLGHTVWGVVLGERLRYRRRRERHG